MTILFLVIVAAAIAYIVGEAVMSERKYSFQPSAMPSPVSCDVIKCNVCGTGRGFSDIVCTACGGSGEEHIAFGPYRTSAEIPVKEKIKKERVPMTQNHKIAGTSMMIGVVTAGTTLTYGFFYPVMSQSMVVVSPIAIATLLISTLIACSYFYSDK